MLFSEIVSLTKFILNSNDTQTDLDISDARLKELINWRYLEEVNKAKQEGSKRYFKAYRDETWTSGTVSFPLPSTVSRAELIEIRDITDDARGSKLALSDTGLTSEVYWLDKSTLRWGTTGPSSARTLRFFYFAQPEKLVEDDDEPELLPVGYHTLLAWSAAVEARTIMDEAAPATWAERLEAQRHDYWKFISRGRPTNGDGDDTGSGGDPWTIDVLAQDGSSIG